MTEPIKLPPIPEWVTADDTRKDFQDYARLAVEQNTAELRAEVDAAKADVEAVERISQASLENIAYKWQMAESKCDELQAEVERLRALIRLDDAEWRDKHIHPCGGESFQSWLVSVYLPVPLSEPDKSPEAALERALAEDSK